MCSAMAAAGRAHKELAIFLIFVVILKSFHLPDSDSTGQTILISQVITLHAGEMTSIANYEAFVPNSAKISVKAKMATVQRIKKLRTLLKYLKLALIAELDISICLLACGDISANPGPTTTSMGNVDVFKLPAKGLRFGQWNVNYLTKTKFEEIKMRLLSSDNRKSLDIMVITETVFQVKH